MFDGVKAAGSQLPWPFIVPSVKYGYYTHPWSVTSHFPNSSTVLILRSHFSTSAS